MILYKVNCDIGNHFVFITVKHYEWGRIITFSKVSINKKNLSRNIRPLSVSVSVSDIAIEISGPFAVNLSEISL